MDFTVVGINFPRLPSDMCSETRNASTQRVQQRLELVRVVRPVGLQDDGVGVQRERRLELHPGLDLRGPRQASTTLGPGPERPMSIPARAAGPAPREP